MATGVRGSRPGLRGAAAALAVVTIGLVSGCSVMDGFVGNVGSVFDRTGAQGAALQGPSQPAIQTPGRTVSSLQRMPNAGPPPGTIRVGKVNNVSHNVALRGGSGATRRFVVQRTDLQPMWSIDRSRDRAVTAVMAAFGGDACSTPGALTATSGSHDPVGLWVIEATCAGGATSIGPVAAR